jgi:hypothetical protein
MVRAGGLEPPRAFAQQILSLVCLPFHHARTKSFGFATATSFSYRSALQTTTPLCDYFK